MTSCLRHFLHKRPQCFHLSITLHLRRTYDGKLRDIYVSGRDHGLFPGECLKAKWTAGSWVKTQLILALYFSPKSCIQKYVLLMCQALGGGEDTSFGGNPCILNASKVGALLLQSPPSSFRTFTELGHVSASPNTSGLCTSSKGVLCWSGGWLPHMWATGVYWISPDLDRGSTPTRT